MAERINASPRTESQLRKSLWNAQKNDETVEADLDALEAVAVRAASAFGTDDVLLASDGTNRGAKATAIDKDNVVTATANFGTNDVVIVSDGTAKAVEASALVVTTIVTAASTFTDDRILRADGSSRGSQSSSASLEDSGRVILRNSAEMESAVLGSELLSESGWTSTNWTGSWAGGWDHTTGNTSVLSNSLAPTVGLFYFVSWTVTGRTAGTFTVSFGNVQAKVIAATGAFTGTFSATDAYGLKAATTAGLSVTPTSDFDGALVLSIKQVTTAPTAEIQVLDSGSVESASFRCFSAAQNDLAIGELAGSHLYTGFSGLGTGNLLFGPNAGEELISGGVNLFIGSAAGRRCTSGITNTYVGADAGRDGVNNGGNLMVGRRAGISQTGNSNTGIGERAAALITGDGNLFIGNSAGDSATVGQTNSVSNSIAIGTNAFTTASNQMVLGSTSITETQTRGRVKIGTFLNLPAATELTIASGVITATQSYHRIDTQSDGATDDLDTINGGTEGDILVIRAENGARDVVCKDATGNLQLAGGDFTLNNVQDMLMLMYDGSNWCEISRSDNSA